MTNQTDDDKIKEIIRWFSDFYGEMNIAETELMDKSFELGRQSAQKEFEDLIRKEKEIVKRVCLGLVQDSLEKIWNNKQDDEWEKI